MRPSTYWRIMPRDSEEAPNLPACLAMWELPVAFRSSLWNAFICSWLNQWPSSSTW